MIQTKTTKNRLFPISNFAFHFNIPAFMGKRDFQKGEGKDFLKSTTPGDYALKMYIFPT